MIHLTSPFQEEKIRSLKVGDMVLITGKLFTGRDAVHKHLHEGGTVPVDLTNQIIYHCGPVVMKKGKTWTVTAAGPTTSSREEPYQADIIKRFQIRGVIGKGGMGEKTKNACKEYGCVYFHAVGGAAQVLAACIERVTGVHMLEEFGSPEAIWELEVKDFPAVVTIDAHGNSLHSDVQKSSAKVLETLLKSS
jgi:fumarate hydratase subunit beta